MTGKEKCKKLREIRKEIANQNNIDLQTEDCPHQGDCPGTCPKCEEEVRYLEQEIEKKKKQGIFIKLKGIMGGLFNRRSSVTEKLHKEKDIPTLGYLAIPLEDRFPPETHSVLPQREGQMSEGFPSIPEDSDEPVLGMSVSPGWQTKSIPSDTYEPLLKTPTSKEERVRDDHLIRFVVRYNDCNDPDNWQEKNISRLRFEYAYIGCAGVNDVIIQNGCISGKQFRFWADNNDDSTFYLENLVDFSLAFINDIPFTGIVTLKGGEEIKIRDITIRIEKIL